MITDCCSASTCPNENIEMFQYYSAILHAIFLRSSVTFPQLVDNNINKILTLGTVLSTYKHVFAFH